MGAGNCGGFFVSDEDAGLTGLCANSAMDLIGSTPLVRLSKLSPETRATYQKD